MLLPNSTTYILYIYLVDNISIYNYNSEWSFGGLPAWLLHFDDIRFRDNNPVWKREMEIFVRWIANLVEPYLARNGGPIMMAQVC